MAGEIRAPRGPALRSKGWGQEAALRMLLNSVDPDVAGAPAPGGPHCDAIIRELESLRNDQTLLVHSGKPAGVFSTQEEAPRALIASSSRAEPACDGEEWLGLILHGWLAAESWTSVGFQHIVQATYETFGAAARKHFRGSLAGKFVVSGGMGFMGGAQPLAAVMNGAAFLGIDADPERIKRRMRSGDCDIMVTTLEEAIRILRNAVHRKYATSVGLVGNCAEILPEMARRGIVPDLLTDQTGLGDARYIPAGLTVEQAARLRSTGPDEFVRRSRDAIAAHVRAMLDLKKLGAVAFDYGNNIRRIAAGHGVGDAYTIPGFVAEYIRPALGAGRVPLRWVALSGEPSDIHAADRVARRLFSGNDSVIRWLELAAKHLRFQGLPARVCWLERSEGVRLALEINRMVASGELKAPVAIAGDNLDCGPNRPLLSALLNAASGASWVAVSSWGGGSLHSGWAAVAEGTEQSARSLGRVMAHELGQP